MKKFFKENIGFVLAAIFNLLMIGFLFTNQFDIVTKVDGVKYYKATNIIDLLNGKNAPSWIGIMYIIYVVIALILLVIAFFLRKNTKIKDGLLGAVLICDCLIFGFAFGNKELFAQFASEKIENFKETKIAWGSGLLMLLASLELFAVISCSEFKKENTKAISEDAILIASAFVLNLIKFFQMPSGGSVNLQMLPLFIIALRRGPLHSFVCSGLVYGLLTCLTDGWAFASFPFDYVIAFGSVALLGFFRKLIMNRETSNITSMFLGELFIFIGVTLATTLRFIAGTLSGVLIWNTELVPSMAYNAPYVFVSGALDLVALMVIYPTLLTINKRFPSEEKISQ